MKIMPVMKFRAFPFTTAFVVMIFVVCMIPIPETPLSGVGFIDKWTHTALYLALGIVFWTEYCRSRISLKPFALFAVSVLLPVVMGGLIEVMQENLTTCRSGEWMDFAADAVGVVAGALLGRCVIMPLFAKVRKGRR